MNTRPNTNRTAPIVLMLAIVVALSACSSSETPDQRESKLFLEMKPGAVKIEEFLISKGWKQDVANATIKGIMSGCIKQGDGKADIEVQGEVMSLNCDSFYDYNDFINNIPSPTAPPAETSMAATQTATITEPELTEETCGIRGTFFAPEGDDEPVPFVVVSTLYQGTWIVGVSPLVRVEDWEFYAVASHIPDGYVFQEGVGQLNLGSGDYCLCAFWAQNQPDDSWKGLNRRMCNILNVP